MEREIKDKIAIVTGGADGLGYNIAEKYLKNGAKVVIILDNNETKGIEAVKALNAIDVNGKAVFIKCDVNKDLNKITRTILKTYNRIDVLVNNAGILDENNIRNMCEVNLIALMEWSIVFWEHMRMDKGGSGGTIVNMASMAGLLVDPFTISYKAVNAAVISFTKSLGHEYNYKKTGVRAVVMCPGLTHTSMTTRQICWNDHAEGFNRLSKVLPWQEPDAVGDAAVNIFKTAESGTSWLIVGGKPVCETPNVINLSLDNVEHPESLVI